MAQKHKISFPAIKIIKKVEGYKQAVETATRETGLEFFNDYLMPIVKQHFELFEWKGKLKEGLIVTINRTGNTFRFTIDSKAKNNEGKKYFSEVITGLPPRWTKYERLEDWVRDKVFKKGGLEPDIIKVTNAIRKKISVKGSERKTTLQDIYRQTQPIIDTEFKILLRKKIKSVRRKFPAG